MQRVSFPASKSWRRSQLFSLFRPATPECRTRGPQLFPRQSQQSRQPFATANTNGRTKPSRALHVRRPPPITQEELMFKPQDIPPMSFWENLAENGPEDLSAEVFDRTTRQYCEIALEPSAGSTWKGRLQMDHGIDPYTLHWTAIVMLNTPPNPLWKLAIHMLQTASDLGYTPSTITVLRVILMMTKGGPEASKYRPRFRTTLEKLGRLVKAGENPDALTLQGLLKFRSGNAVMALREFDRAIDAARRAGKAYAPIPTKRLKKEASSNGEEDAASQLRDPHWLYETDCHVARGSILLKLGQRDAAFQSFSIAAFELDSPTAYLELGKLLPLDSPQRDEYLLKAAISGKLKETCPLLSASETAKSREAGSDKELAEEHLRWAAEWDLLGRKQHEVDEEDAISA